MRKFIEAFYINILGASDYWYRFEWQHRGSPHVHGIAWFQGAPDVEKMLASTMDEDLMAKPNRFLNRLLMTLPILNLQHQIMMKMNIRYIVKM